MTISERNRRKNYLPGGIKGLETLLAEANNGVSPVNDRMIGMILRGERRDLHGVLELFKAVTDKEMKRRQDQAKELAAKLES